MLSKNPSRGCMLSRPRAMLAAALRSAGFETFRHLPSAAVSAGVAAALERLFDSPDIANAIRLGVRDAVWNLGVAANATEEPSETNR